MEYKEKYARQLILETIEYDPRFFDKTETEKNRIKYLYYLLEKYCKGRSKALSRIIRDLWMDDVYTVDDLREQLKDKRKYARFRVKWCFEVDILDDVANHECDPESTKLLKELGYY